MRRSASDSSWGLPFSVILIIVNLVVYMLQNINWAYLKLPAEQYLALSHVGLQKGYVWQLFTFQFLHGGHLHFICNALGIYCLGRPVEESVGRMRFLEIYFFSGFVGGLFQATLGWLFPAQFGYYTVGASAGVFGLLAVFALLEPDRTLLFMMVLPLRAWTVLVVSLLVALFFVIVPSDPGIAHAAHLGGLIGGMIYVRWILRAERRLFDWRPYRSVVRQRELVHTATIKQPSWRAQKVIEEEIPSSEFISREVDPILDKISAHGIQSLTDHERKILEAARKKMARR